MDQGFPPTWWERDTRIVRAAATAAAADGESTQRLGPPYPSGLTPNTCTPCNGSASSGSWTEDRRVVGVTAAAKSLFRLQLVLELLDHAVDGEVGREITTREFGNVVGLGSGFVDPGCYALAQQGLAEAEHVRVHPHSCGCPRCPCAPSRERVRMAAVKARRAPTRSDMARIAARSREGSA
jgi:hypothetical protein